MAAAGSHARSSSQVWAFVALLVGAAVAVSLGVYGRVHTPAGEPLTTLGFESMLAMKVWLGSAVGGLAVIQLLTAAGMYARGGRAIALAHRMSGTLAVLVSLPVAFHCLWAVGFGDYGTRVLIHSLAGCLIYGALVTKLLALHVRRMPGWLVTVAGSLLLTCVVAATLTSAVWYFTEVGVP